MWKRSVRNVGIFMMGVIYCASVLTAPGLSIQLRNAMASAALTATANSASENALIMIKMIRAVPALLRESAGIRVRLVSGYHAGLKDGRHAIARILIQRVYGRF
jgi:hypothetical protein